MKTIRGKIKIKSWSNVHKHKLKFLNLKKIKKNYKLQNCLFKDICRALRVRNCGRGYSLMGGGGELP